MSEATSQQTPPTEDSRSQVVLYALRDIVPAAIYAALEERAEMGLKKYGTFLKSFNGRNCLLDAKQEAYDLIMYGQQAVLEGRSKGYVRNRGVGAVELIESLELPWS